VTDACDLRCRYCRPERARWVPRAGEPLRLAELVSLVACINTAVGIEKLRFTGGEPLLRGDLPELVVSCARMGIGDLALTTNAQRLAELAGTLAQCGLNRINVSLDSLAPATYRAITRGGDLRRCLAGINAAIDHGLLPMKLNAVILREANDHEVGALLDFALARGCHMRFLELMPIGVAASTFEQDFVSWREVYDSLSERYELTPLPVRPGATSRNYRVRDSRNRETVLGFISPMTAPFCSGCNRLRLTSHGMLLGCLARQHRLDLRPALANATSGDEGPLLSAINEALATKKECHDLSRQREMAHIGG